MASLPQRISRIACLENTERSLAGFNSAGGFGTRLWHFKIQKRQPWRTEAIQCRAAKLCFKFSMGSTGGSVFNHIHTIAVIKERKKERKKTWLHFAPPHPSTFFLQAMSDLSLPFAWPLLLSLRYCQPSYQILGLVKWVVPKQPKQGSGTARLTRKMRKYSIHFHLIVHSSPACVRVGYYCKSPLDPVWVIQVSQVLSRT